MTGWVSMAASRRGTSHERRGEPRQDVQVVRHLGAAGDILLVIVADGAGSAPRGGAGAALACRVLAAEATAALRHRPIEELDGEALHDWVDVARDALFRGATAQGLPGRALATTVLLALSDGRTTLVGHVGDGAVVARDAEDGSWRALSWPATGEHAGTTFFLTDDPSPALRIECRNEPITALALLTDGLERLVLDLAARAPHGPFFDRMTAPLDRLAADGAGAPGLDRRLSRELGRYLDGERVCARSDDDKTMAVAVRRPDPPAAPPASAP